MVTGVYWNWKNVSHLCSPHWKFNTGSLESRFFKGRQKNVARRMNEAAMNHRMRIHMNGPDVEAFCRRELLPGPAGGVKYHASALCKRSKAHYRNRFGSKSLSGRERRLRRRMGQTKDRAAISQYVNNGKKKGLKIGRMAHHLREKRTQAAKTFTGKVSDIWPPYCNVLIRFIFL